MSVLQRLSMHINLWKLNLQLLLTQNTRLQKAKPAAGIRPSIHINAKPKVE